LVEKTTHSREAARVLIDGKLSHVAVDEASSEKLPDTLLRQLAEACQMLEHYHQPQDIEFAVRRDAIYFLQSRPITTQP
jgi:phosphoenolpyruvate synthase/pyruvate phosphate dikinase